MNATAHPVAPEEVMAFLDGEVLPDVARSVSAHIETCAECHQVGDALSIPSQSLLHWGVPVAPANPVSEERLTQSANASVRSHHDFFSSLRKIFGVRLPLSWGAAALIVLVSVMIGLSSRRFARSVPASGIQVFLREKGRQEVLVPLDIGPAPPAHVGQGSGNGKGPVSVDSSKRPKTQGGLITLASPGVVADSNGLFRGLGDQTQNAVSGDGRPPSDQQSHFFSGPMIARTVSLSIVVKDFDRGRASLDAILARHNGYAASLSVSSPEGAARVIQASLRIAAPQLGTALNELKSLGRVEGETQNGEEVTQQHADLVARIKNDRETELRLQDILRTRTGKVKDVLDVEQEIARVRGEIEQMEAEQKTLEHRVDFATIDLKLAEEYKAQLNTPAPSVLIEVRNASINGFRNAFETLWALVLFFAESGPSLLLWLALVGIPAWRLWRRYRRAHSLGSLAGA